MLPVSEAYDYAPFCHIKIISQHGESGCTVVLYLNVAANLRTFNGNTTRVRSRSSYALVTFHMPMLMSESRV